MPEFRGGAVPGSVVMGHLIQRLLEAILRKEIRRLGRWAALTVDSVGISAAGCSRTGRDGDSTGQVGHGEPLAWAGRM